MSDQPRATRKMSGATKTLRDKLSEMAGKACFKQKTAHQLTTEYEDLVADMACAASKRGKSLMVTTKISDAVLHRIRSIGALRITTHGYCTEISWE